METHGKEKNSDQKNNNPLEKKSHVGKSPPSIDNEKQTYETNWESDYNKNNPPKGFCERWKKDSPANRIIAIFTILLGLTAIPLVIIGICQAKYSRNSIKEAQKALAYNRWNDSTNAIEQKKMSNSSIAISKKIANTQERFAKIETRAYVCVDTLMMYPPIVGEKMQYSIFSINTGRTPANHLKAKSVQKMYGKDVYKFDFQRFEKEPADSTKYVPLGPDRSKYLDFTSNRIFTQTDYDTFIKKRNPFFIIGMITYIDMLGGKDTTRFCYKFVIPDTAEIWSTYNEVK